jgi:hypothetical protein
MNQNKLLALYFSLMAEIFWLRIKCLYVAGSLICNQGDKNTYPSIHRAMAIATATVSEDRGFKFRGVCVKILGLFTYISITYVMLLFVI